MNKRQQSYCFFKKRRAIAIIVFILVFLFFSSSKNVLAVGGVMFDPTASIQRELDKVIQMQDQVREIKEETQNKVWKKLLETLKKIGSKLYQGTLSTALNILAYDTANYIATGGEGQTTLFTREYITDFAKKAGEAAVGEFIDVLGKDWQVDLCRPNIDFQAKIGLGLKRYQKPEYSSPRCDWQKMKNAWTDEYHRWADMTRDDYLGKLAGMFDPAGNEVFMALELFGRSDQIAEEETKKMTEQLKTSGGWLDVRNIAGKSETIPGDAENKKNRVEQITAANFGKITGDIFADAANIFLNQLYIKAWDEMMSSLANKESKDDPKIDHSDSSIDPKASFTQKYVTDSLKKIIKPRFDVRADYDILANLMVCLDKKNPAPDNCVLDSRFAQAVQEKYTVIEAVEKGYLDPNRLFSNDHNYESAFTERSLMLLRKYRIIPVGWEEALKRSEEKKLTTGFSYSLMDMISCFDPNDEYNTFSQGFLKSNFTNHSWCEGLVDPYWILKAPLNYCKRQGYGSYVLNKELLMDVDGGFEVSELGSSYTIEGGGTIFLNDNFLKNQKSNPFLIVRSDSYCADEQTCIKEKADGSCEVYGYCTEEKRIWSFDKDSCDPVYNTCDSFTSLSNGKKLALLQNAIDYGDCSADNAGCARYSLNGIYGDEAKIKWNEYPVIHFNSKVEPCSSGAEGCQELIRTKTGAGYNFLLNGNFEDKDNLNDWISSVSATTSEAYRGELALEVGGTLNRSVAVAPSGYTIAGETYNLSFYSYCEGEASSTVALGSKVQSLIDNSADYTYQSINFTYPGNYSSNLVSFSINTGEDTHCLIDNIKLEKGGIGTFYSDYRENGVIYEKIIPDYLKNLCYQNPFTTNPDYRLKENAPSECYKYARLCNLDEISCNIFKSAQGLEFTAKVIEKDYCPEQCVGYDVYIQKETLFSEKSLEKMIPESARSCPASSVGCSEFTNLDSLAAGGEGKEYYSQLRHCIKPNQGTCANFYSWEGNDESGYQLRSFSLEEDSTGKPKITDNLGYLSLSNGAYIHNQVREGFSIDDPIASVKIVCNNQIYNSGPSSPSYNPDCREFYNQAGEKFYVLYSSTITCSDNCKTYRLSNTNINSEKTSSSECSNLNSGGKIVAHWDTASDSCFHCLAGGRWDTSQQACLYQAIPGEGQSCSASNNGCREYVGNSGSRNRIIFSSDFSSDYDLNKWQGSFSTSSESLNQYGQSVKLNGDMETSAKNITKKGYSYVLKFLAKNKSSQNVSLDIYFSNGSKDKKFGILNDDFSSIKISPSNNWSLYQVNLDNLDHDITDSEVLRISPLNAGEIYIASISLLEISDRYYLIKDSWNTPNLCYYDVFNNYRGVNYNLGCQAYQDKDKQPYYLRQLSSFCDESAVGCELVIKTHNYDSPKSAIFNDANNNGSCDVDEPDCIYVPADEYSALVVSPDKFCSPANKGCQRMGKLSLSNLFLATQNIYRDVYLKNDPNKYELSLCQANEMGCDAWKSDSGFGTSYFKDPGDNICQWQQGTDTASGFAWYKKAVKKCTSNNGASFTDKLCLNDSDCSVGQTCQLDNNKYLCPVDPLKTIGYGGGSPIYQPSSEYGVNWVGLCPLKQAGCTEYIDPLSSFSANIIQNPNFADLNGDGQGFDNWTKTNNNEVAIHNGAMYAIAGLGSSAIFEQKLENLMPNKLYILESKGKQNAKITCNQPIYRLMSNNKLVALEDNKAEVGYNGRLIFFSANNGENNCVIRYEKNNLILLPENLEAELGITIGYKNKFINKIGKFVNKVLNIKTSEAQEDQDDNSIEIREAIIDYQLRQSLNSSGCQGETGLDQGCILFNERSFQGGDGLKSLEFKADDYSNFSSCNNNSPDCNANKIIKVKANRVCAKWLDCMAAYSDPQSGEKVCLTLGECDTLNYDGTCFNFTKPSEGNRIYTPGRDNNATGYSVLGLNYLANMYQLGDDQNNYIEYNFENISDLNNWEGLPSDNIDKNKCLVDRVNHSLLSGKKVTYPASGLGFLAVGGFGSINCGMSGGNFLRTGLHNNFIPGNNYYLSFLINTEDLRAGQEAIIKIVGIKNGHSIWNNSEGGEPHVYKIGREKGWRSLGIEFKAKDDWFGGLRIVLESSGTFFIDDIKIEPVLKIKDKVNGVTDYQRFIPATCRLYPSEDSLFCESVNKNFIANGWYGYCLEKDPENLEVCLLWYPVDSVLGKKGLNQPSTAFTGYTETGGANPYYCAEMEADFDLLEHRKPFFLKTDHIKNTSYFNMLVNNIKGKSSGYYSNNPQKFDDGWMFFTSDSYPIVSEDHDIFSYENFFVALSLSGSFKEQYTVSNNTINLYNKENVSCPLGYSILRVLAKISQNEIGGENIAIIRDYYCIPKSKKGKISICQSTYSSDKFNGCITNYVDFTEKGSDLGDFRYIGKDDVVEFSDQGYLLQRNKNIGNANYYSSAWTKVMGSRISSKKPSNDLDCNDSCAADGFDFFILTNNAGWYSYNGLFGPINIVSHTYSNGYGIVATSTSEKDLAPDKSGYLWDFQKNEQNKKVKIDDYSPKCSIVVQGEIPWVSRLNSSSYSLANYYNLNTSTSNSLLGEYKRTLSYNPFGAVKKGDNFNNSKVEAGSGTNKGIPYSCNSASREVCVSDEGYKSSCRALYLGNSSQVRVLNPYSDDYQIMVLRTKTSKNNYNEQAFWSNTHDHGINYYAQIMKYIWLKTSCIYNKYENIPCGYDFSQSIDFDSERSSDLQFLAVLPKINKFGSATNGPVIRIYNRFGGEILPVNGKYHIGSSGNYVIDLSFDVDKEQTPVKEVIIKAKRSGSEWTSSEGYLKISNLDPYPSTEEPFRIYQNLMSGDYQFFVKVVDNWGLYTCAGDSRVENSSNEDCQKCCTINSFLDSPGKNYCNSCFSNN